jgi:hypothetical protein
VASCLAEPAQQNVPTLNIATTNIIFFMENLFSISLRRISCLLRAAAHSHETQKPIPTIANQASNKLSNFAHSHIVDKLAGRNLLYFFSG